MAACICNTSLIFIESNKIVITYNKCYILYALKSLSYVNKG